MKKLTKAFKALRKAGYFAEENFWCCQSCGWNAIPEEAIDKVVFYHSQDAEDLELRGECYVSWDGNVDEIIDILEENGIKTEWDGNISTRIKIFIKS